jgi:hypothetical protein
MALQLWPPGGHNSKTIVTTWWSQFSSKCDHQVVTTQQEFEPRGGHNFKANSPTKRQPSRSPAAPLLQIPA